MFKTLTLASIYELQGFKEEALTIYEEILKKELDPTTKIGLYVHLSCLLERLILRQGINYVEGMDKFFQVLAK